MSRALEIFLSKKTRKRKLDHSSGEFIAFSSESESESGPNDESEGESDSDPDSSESDDVSNDKLILIVEEVYTDVIVLLSHVVFIFLR